MLQDPTARTTWQYLEDEFFGQRESHALLLEAEFRSFKQGDLSITDYSRRLEMMAAALKEFGDPVGDKQLVLTFLHGLSAKFRHMVPTLKTQCPFPTFVQARTLLLLEELDVNDFNDDAVSESKTSTQALVMTPQARPPPTPIGNGGGGGGGNCNRRRGRGGNGGGNGGGAASSGNGGGGGNRGTGLQGPRPDAPYGNPWSGSVQPWPHGFGGLPGYMARPPLDQPQQALHMMPYQGATPRLHPLVSAMLAARAPRLRQLPPPTGWQGLPWSAVRGIKARSPATSA
jgi:hypothetical protein